MSSAHVATMLVESPAAPPHQPHQHLHSDLLRDPILAAEGPALPGAAVPPSPPRTPSLNIQRHKDASPPDVTYSRFVNGSILSVPKTIETAARSPLAATAVPASAPVSKMGGGVSPGDSLVASVYGFVKYFLR